MDPVLDGALGLVDAKGQRGLSEAAIIRSFPVPLTTSGQIRSGLDDLAEAGYIERTIKTRTGGWVYRVTTAGTKARAQ
jgi:DNA-binding PadR family transcriptional regulator